MNSVFPVDTQLLTTLFVLAFVINNVAPLISFWFVISTLLNFTPVLIGSFSNFTWTGLPSSFTSKVTSLVDFL